MSIDLKPINFKKVNQDTQEVSLFQDNVDQAIQQINSNQKALNEIASTSTLYKFVMTGDLFKVTSAYANVLGSNLAPVGNGTTVPFVQVKDVVIQSTKDIVDIKFSALAVPSATADLLMGYQVDSLPAKWGQYASKGSSTLIALVNESIDGLTPGKHVIKLMALKSGTGTVDISAADSVTYDTFRGPGGSIFTVKVTTTGA